MDIEITIAELSSMHPRLLWDEITLAALAVLADGGRVQPFKLELAVRDMPQFGTDKLSFIISQGNVDSENIGRIRRTYEPPRLVELAAIAVAGLGLYYAGGHEIREVAFRGSGSDYSVNKDGQPLEVAGRSRHSDLESAWEKKWQRLTRRVESGFFVCVVEFETLSGRLAFAI